MKSLITTCLLVSILLILTGCKSVTSDHLIGVPVDSEEAAEFEGAWDIYEGAVHIKHLDGANLKVAWLDWDNEKNEFKLNRLHVVVTKLADTQQKARYVQMVAEEEDDGGPDPGETGDVDTEKTPWLLLGLINKSGDHALVLFGPNFEVFEEAIRSGELRGTVEEDGNQMHIQADKAALDAFIAGHTHAELFQMDDPGVITRIGGTD